MPTAALSMSFWKSPSNDRERRIGSSDGIGWVLAMPDAAKIIFLGIDSQAAIPNHGLSRLRAPINRRGPRDQAKNVYNEACLAQCGPRPGCRRTRETQPRSESSPPARLAETRSSRAAG